MLTYFCSCVCGGWLFVDVVRSPWTICVPGSRRSHPGSTDPDAGARQLDERGDAVWSWHPEVCPPEQAGGVSTYIHRALHQGPPEPQKPLYAFYIFIACLASPTLTILREF